MWIVTFIPLIATLLLIRFLPAEVPMHYDIEGNIDRWGSKYEQLILPGVIIVMTLFMQALIWFYGKQSNKTEDEKKKAELKSNINVLYIVSIATTIMFIVMQGAFLYQAFEATPDTAVMTVDINQIMTVMLGIILIIFGNYMPKTKINGMVGFRTAKTMKNEENWKKANKFAGIVFVIAGIAMIILGLSVPGNAAMAIAMVMLLLALVVCMMYVGKLD